MNALVELTSKVATANHTSVASEIMMVCRAVTPQFYKSMTDKDVAMELAAMRLFLADKEIPVIAKMCEFAVRGYGLTRSKNLYIHFDLNYILTFYEQAFNFVNCESVEIPLDAERDSNTHYCPPQFKKRL